MPAIEPVMDRPQGVVSAVSGAVGVLLRLQVGLEDPFEHRQHRRLHHAISDRADAQRTLLAVRLGDIHPPHGLRTITLLPEFCHQFVQPLPLAVLLDVLERLAVDARFAVVGTTAEVGIDQHVAAEHFVVQRVEAELGVSLRFGMQRLLQLLNRCES